MPTRANVIDVHAPSRLGQEENAIASGTSDNHGTMARRKSIMPSPAGHILGGTFVYLIGTSPQQRSNLIMTVTLLGSVAPDFDFVPGIVIGEPGAFHHGVSHSLGFAILFGTLVCLFLRYFRCGVGLARATIMAALAYGLHAVLDGVSVNEGARSVPLLWPLSQHEFGINFGLWGHFHHDGLADGLWSVLRPDNLSALIRELAVLGIPPLLIYFVRAKSVDTGSGNGRVSK